jgi:acetolactate synthase-1/2/3 large subunit
MGWALPASLGVAAADPNNKVVAIIGDGAIQTNIQELQTLAHHRFNVKLFIINNDGYLSIRNTQKNFFKGFYVGSTVESGVTLPDLEKISSAYGIPFVRCPDRSQLASSIRQTLDTPGPVICEVMAQVDQRVIPLVPSYMLPNGAIRSKALHEMAPEIPVSFEDLLKELQN